MIVIVIIVIYCRLCIETKLKRCGICQGAHFLLDEGIGFNAKSITEEMNLMNQSPVCIVNLILHLLLLLKLNY